MATAQDIRAFKARFSDFKLTDDASIAAVLNTADVFLDPRVWPSARDFALARMYWAAHLLSLMQMNSANATLSGGAGGSSADLFVREIHIGERTVMFQQRRTFEKSDTGTGPGEEMLTATLYGQLFIQLRTRNFPLVMVL